MPAEPTIPALLRHHAEAIPDAPALVHDDERVTYAELDARTRAVAAQLTLSKSARVGILAPNGIDWAVAAYAASRIGAVLVPLSTLLRPPELQAQLRGASVTHLITASTYRGRDYLADLNEIAPGIEPVLAAGSRHEQLPSLKQICRLDDLTKSNLGSDHHKKHVIQPQVAGFGALAEALEARVRPADDLAIMFTSGSRGAPKGVLHTHGGALRAVASGLEARCIGPGERLYIPMPFFWMGGFGGGLLSALVAGATLLTESDPTPASTLAFLEREQVTLFRGWPDQAARIAADPAFAGANLTSLKPGSLDALLPPELKAAPGARANLFGMTETFGPYCGSHLDRDMPTSAHGSCGQPFDGVEVRILDDDGHPLTAGEVGEIAVRGPNVMKGIVGRPRAVTFTVDGFYRTGDLGHLDDNGYLFYGGRTDDMFKVSGATVYPTEVEAALRASDRVAQVYVTNVPTPEGDVVGAAVVPKGSVTEAQLAADAKARLSAFKIPKRWAILASPNDVPTMATGKVDKAGLQRLLTQRMNPEEN